MKDCSLSVIIPAYNCEETITKCIASITCQKIKDVEIICVDDGSTDNTLSILKGLEKNNKIIRVFSQKNKYAGAARNLGLKHAVGEYVLFLDADDCVIKGTISKLLSFAHQMDTDIIKYHSRNVEFVSQKENIIENPYTLKISNKLYGKRLTYKEAGRELLYSPCTPWSGIFKRAFLIKNEIQFNSLQRVNDRSFFIRSVCLAESFAFYNAFVIEHISGNANSLAGGRRTVKGFDNNFKSLEIILRDLSDQSDDLRRDVIEEELYRFSGDYNSCSEEVKMEYKKSPYKEIIAKYIAGTHWRIFHSDQVVLMLRYMFENEADGIIKSYVQNIYKELNKCRIKNIEELMSYTQNDSCIAVYGAGKVAKELVKYAKSNELYKKLFCVLVSKKEGNPEDLEDIPVCRVYEADYREIDIVIIATQERIQKEVYEELLGHHPTRVYAVSNYLWAQMRKANINSEE